MQITAFLVLAISLALVHAEPFSEQELDIHFMKFKNDFSRSYSSQTEELRRKSIFRANLEFIFYHNIEAFKGVHTFTVGVNNFTDLTNAEFSNQLRLSTNPTPSSHVKDFEATLLDLSALPASIDWVAKGAVTPPINQGQCGSSWEIPIVSAVEGKQAIATGKLVPLSNQQMIDCCTNGGNNGCNGGFMDSGYECIINQGGLDTAASYPYSGNSGVCKFNAKTVGATIQGWVDLAKSEVNLQAAVALVGPIAAAIDASQQSFQFYASGVYVEPACLQTVDHGVTVVGYGTQTGTDFWKVKNSWGTSWGMGGYILMARNQKNMCGIANAASYPV